MSNEHNDILKDVFTKHYNGDFTNLTNNEIKLIIQNFFYQYFLIKLNNIEITTHYDEYGMFADISVSGECFKDPMGIPPEDLVELQDKKDD